VKDLAKMSALAHKAKEGKIVVVEDLKMDAPKTKAFSTILGALKGDNRKSLVVLPEYEDNVYLSGRNLASNKTVILSDMNTYDLMYSNVVIFTESAAKLFQEPVGEEAEA
jgi:large subunit ribosomal protein L4